MNLTLIWGIKVSFISIKLMTDTVCFLIPIPNVSNKFKWFEQLKNIVSISVPSAVNGIQLNDTVQFISVIFVPTELFLFCTFFPLRPTFQEMEIRSLFKAQFSGGIRRGFS